GLESLRASGFAHRDFQAITGRRVADASAGIDVVVAECCTHQLLHQIAFFVRAARRHQAADGTTTVFGLDALDFGSGVVDRFFPRYFLPRIRDFLADHRLEHAV